MAAKKRFKWTDQLAMQFARITAAGQYGPYRNAKSMKQKLFIFKKINTPNEIES